MHRKGSDARALSQALKPGVSSAFAGLRNTAVHDPDPWTEQEALEHLAVLSVVARWADETEVVAVPAQGSEAGD